MVKINKKAWIKIIEAFFSAMLVMVILILVVNQQSNQTGVRSDLIYNSEISIIRVIQLNNTLRGEVINQSLSVPVNSENSSFPSILNNTITLATPGGIECETQICEMNSTCNYWKNSKTNIYAQETLISANLTNYNPRKLKLFCWEK